jgi:hypothetical protein
MNWGPAAAPRHGIEGASRDNCAVKFHSMPSKAGHYVVQNQPSVVRSQPPRHDGLRGPSCRHAGIPRRRPRAAVLMVPWLGADAVLTAGLPQRQQRRLLRSGRTSERRQNANRPSGAAIMAPCGTRRYTGAVHDCGDRDDIRRREARLGVRWGGGSREENRCLRETGRDGGATRGVGLHEEEIGGDPREIGLPAVEGRHVLGGWYGFHCKGMTVGGVPLLEVTQPAPAVRLQG